MRTIPSWARGQVSVSTEWGRGSGIMLESLFLLSRLANRPGEIHARLVFRRVNYLSAKLEEILETV